MNEQTKKSAYLILLFIFLLTGCNKTLVKPKQKIINCITPSSEEISSESFEGIIVTRGAEDIYYVNDLSSGERSKLGYPDDEYNLRNVSFSPSKQYFTYETDDEKSILHLLNADNTIVKEITWDKNYSVIDWISDEEVIVRIRKDFGDLDVQPNIKDYDYFKLNLFTEERSAWSLPSYTFKNIYNFEEFYNPWYFYDPWYLLDDFITVSDTKDFAAYLHEGLKKYIVYDLRNGVEFDQVENEIAFESPPIWSPDGSRFVFTKKLSQDPVQQEIYLYTLSNKSVRQISFFQDYADPEQTILVGDYKWSPNGRNLLFMLYGNPGAKNNNQFPWDGMGIIDFDKNTISHYCLGKFMYRTRWSPDSKYVAINDVNDIENITDKTVVFDVINQTAFLVAADEFPVVWLDPKP